MLIALAIEKIYSSHQYSTSPSTDPVKDFIQAQVLTATFSSIHAI